MKLLPRNICAHPDGYMVRVQRGKVLFQAFVPKSNPRAVERCVELRDNFLRIAGEVQYPKSRRPHRTGRSNTGIPGISETVKWCRLRSYPCFNVSWSVLGRQRMKRFVFGHGVTRETAFQRAIEHRRNVTEVVHA